jgi:hypothetical protein
MICTDCKTGADTMTEIRRGNVEPGDLGQAMRKVKKAHRKCKGGTHCPCQHVISRVAEVGQPVTDQVPTAGGE